MYHYLHHELLHKPKYSKHIIHIEGALHKLGLEGKTTKLGKYASLEESLHHILKQSASTLVIIGDDDLFTRAVSFVADKKNQPVIGYLPVFETTPLTESLGIPVGEAAVLTLAKRRIEKINLAYAGDDFFITSMAGDSSKVSVSINHNTTITSQDSHGRVYVFNYPDHALNERYRDRISPHDSFMEVVFMSGKHGLLKDASSQNITGFFSEKSIIIEPVGKSASVTADGCRELKTPLELGVSKLSVSLITGKRRAN